MSKNSILFASLHITDGSDIAAADLVTSSGATIRKYIALPDLLTALSSKFTSYSFYLPAGCLAYVMYRGLHTFVVVRPEHRRPLLLPPDLSVGDSPSTSIEMVQDCLCPQCIWKITLDFHANPVVRSTTVAVLPPAALQVLQSSGNLSVLSPYLRRMPFPNVYENGSICWGKCRLNDLLRGVTRPNYALLDPVINLFWGSPFNNDLGTMRFNGSFMSKVSFIRQHLVGQSTFPYEALEPLSPDDFSL